MRADRNKRGVRRGCGAARPGGGKLAPHWVPAGSRGAAPAGAGAVQERPHGPAPIWLAALSAAACRATRSGEDHAVRWDCVSGHAVYTNAGADTETIHPLGVSLEGGQTLSVCWMPGETDYTLRVSGRSGVRA
ncbi:MAG: hypothetical protein ABSF25_14630 [Bryobacteraceae bacterium]|jgi:hypothetical protein